MTGAAEEQACARFTSNNILLHAGRCGSKDIEGILQQEEEAVTSLGEPARDAALDLWFEDHVRDDPGVGHRAISDAMGVDHQRTQMKSANDSGGPGGPGCSMRIEPHGPRLPLSSWTVSSRKHQCLPSPQL